MLKNKLLKVIWTIKNTLTQRSNTWCLYWVILSYICINLSCSKVWHVCEQWRQQHHNVVWWTLGDRGYLPHRPFFLYFGHEMDISHFQIHVRPERFSFSFCLLSQRSQMQPITNDFDFDRHDFARYWKNYWQALSTQLVLICLKVRLLVLSPCWGRAHVND